MDQHSESLLATILETAVDAIVVIDQRGVIQLINEATTRMFGYQSSELVGQNVQVLMPSPDREHHDGYLSQYLETGNAKIIGIGREVQAMRKDGTVFPIKLSVSEVGSLDRRLFAGIIHDITNLKETQERLAVLNDRLEEEVRQRTAELREAQADLVKAEKLATLGQVAGGIAHEIRNPLSVMRTSAFFLKRAKNPTPEKVNEHLDRIERQISMVDNVVTALADVARLPEPRVCKCDVRLVVGDVLRSIKMPPDVALDQSISTDCPPANIDPNQVAIVFRNLFRNARDAMSGGGTLRVGASTHEAFLVVSVSDTGTGIAAKDLNRILEPLYSTKSRGMGLGLAICVAILEKNKGRLEVRSELGVGTEFDVFIPLFDEA